MYIKLDTQATPEVNFLKTFRNAELVSLNNLPANQPETPPSNLATHHNSPQSLSVNWYYNSVQIIESTTPNFPRTPPVRVQNDIQKFSRNARKNMINKLSKLNISAYNQIFLATFTYHDKFPTTRKEQKADLDRLQKKMKAANNSLDYFWRIELQKRGAPHFHYLLCLKNSNKVFTESEMLAHLIHLWRSVLGTWDKSMQFYSVHCKDLKNVRSSLAYMSKYIAKEDESLDSQIFGRRWGTSEKINLSPFKTTRHTKDFIRALRYTIHKYLASKLTIGKEWSNAILHAKSITVLLSPKEQLIIFTEAAKRYRRLCQDERYNWNPF
jgi:hypothetical protein